MSLLELFKQNVAEHYHSHWQRNHMAEFISGYYSGALGVKHLHHELKECVKDDDEALYFWGKAMENLSHSYDQSSAVTGAKRVGSYGDTSLFASV